AVLVDEQLEQRLQARARDGHGQRLLLEDLLAEPRALEQQPVAADRDDRRCRHAVVVDAQACVYEMLAQAEALEPLLERARKVAARDSIQMEEGERAKVRNDALGHAGEDTEQACTARIGGQAAAAECRCSQTAYRCSRSISAQTASGTRPS